MKSTHMKSAVIVIPTYNEAENIVEVVETVLRTTQSIRNWSFRLLIVDSSSPDKTGEIVKNLAKKNSKISVISTEKEGLGKAYVDGFSYALEHYSPEVLFEMDADMSHDPRAVKLFINSIDDGADFVIGTRYSRGGSIPKDWGIDRKFFSIFGNIIIRLGFMKPSITDWTSGFRAIKASIIKENIEYIKKYTGYVFQVAILDRAIKQHADIREVPITFIDRLHGVSKINTGQYTIATLQYVFSQSPFIKYVIVGLSGVVVDFGLSYLFIERAAIAIWIATIMSSEMAIISNFLLNNFWAFSHKKISGNSGLVGSFAKFNAVAVGSIVIQAVLVQLFSNLLGKKYWYIYKALVLGFIVIPYSYFLYNKVVWKKPDRTSTTE